MKIWSKGAILTITCAIAAAMILPGRAQNYPSGPVTLVIGNPAGGAGDIIAGAISEKLAKALGQPVNIEYRSGASGAIGASKVARAAPDGRTLLLGQTTEIVINRALAREIGYDPESDFLPVALLATMPLALIVPNNAPYSTIEELLEASRSSPRGLSFASTGAGTPGHLAGELLRIRTSGRFTHVPFDGGAQALNAVLNNRVDFHFQALPTAMPEVRAGKLKILALSSAQRSPAVPNVPTVEESGIKDFDVTLWAGIFAPRRTPNEIVTRINREIDRILAQPDVQESLTRAGAELRPMSVPEFMTFVRSETDRYDAFIKQEFCSRLLYGGCGGLGAAINLLP
jgi:tripartite-type tricarboxylate transporter receptor subunit TctC